MSRLIVFDGTVGSGKSTQIKLLASRLTNSGLKTKRTYFKMDHLSTYLFEKVVVKLLARNGGNSGAPIRWLIDNKPELLVKLFKFLLILDILNSLIKFIFSIYIPLKIKRIVIVEEYIPSTISTVIYRTKLLGFTIKKAKLYLDFMLRLLYLGGSFRTIFLDARDEILRDRWNRRRSINEKWDYLQMQRTILLKLSKSFSQNFIYIDTSEKNVKETHEMIVKFLVHTKGR